MLKKRQNEVKRNIFLFDGAAIEGGYFYWGRLLNN